jgi:DNA-binding GntR family transcriptional regulator
VASDADGRTKRDQVLDELQKLIISGEVPRGAPLQQDELARRFGTSITPVREALRLLESEGLVISQPHRGVRVATADEDRLKATYVMRRLLETHAMRRAALRVSRRDLATAREINRRLADAAAADDDMATREANREFHFLFYERCGRPAMVDRIRSLWLVFPWEVLLVLHDRTMHSVEDHDELCDVMEQGDLDAVGEVVERHLRTSYFSLMQRLHGGGEDQRDPFDPEVD